jgi:flagellar basal body-associated protein FliL
MLVVLVVLVVLLVLVVLVVLVVVALTVNWAEAESVEGVPVTFTL